MRPIPVQARSPNEVRRFLRQDLARNRLIFQAADPPRAGNITPPLTAPAPQSTAPIMAPVAPRAAALTPELIDLEVEGHVDVHVDRDGDVDGDRDVHGDVDIDGDGDMDIDVDNDFGDIPEDYFNLDVSEDDLYEFAQSFN